MGVPDRGRDGKDGRRSRLDRCHLPAFAAVLCLSIAAFIGPRASGHAAAATQPAEPNWIVIMTDDQDVVSLNVMPAVRRWFVRSGVTFSNSFVSYPLCCPSRATYLTGQYTHNHGVWGSSQATGIAAFDDTETLPVWLDRAGYRTAHIGKYLNGYGIDDPTEVPPGWDHWRGLVDPSTYHYYGFKLNRDGIVRTYGSPKVADPAIYQTDVLATEAVAELRHMLRWGSPFFLSVAFLTPHAEAGYDGKDRRFDPRPAPRDVGRYRGRFFARPLSFNEEDVSDKPPHIRNRRIFAGPTQREVEARARRRREALLAVDRAVDRLMTTARDAGVLVNTYVVFTSDNGFFQGEHRIPWGKFLPYEPSIRVPFLIRGPRIVRGATSREPIVNVDLAATVAASTPIEPGHPIDGRSLLPFATDPTRRSTRPILLETSPDDLDPAWDPPDATTWPRYSGVRTDRYKLVRYVDGSTEFYDLSRDRYELESGHADPAYAPIIAWLSDILRDLRACAGEDCATDVGAAPPIAE